MLKDMVGLKVVVGAICGGDGQSGVRIAHLWSRKEVAMSGLVEAKVKDPTAFVMGTAGQGAPIVGSGSTWNSLVI